MSAIVSPWDAPGVANAVDSYWSAPDECLFRAQLVADLLPRLQGHEVLEFGCGSGRIYEALRDAGAFVQRDYRGVDSSRAMLAIAYDRYPEASWEYGAIETSVASAENVLLIQVLQHLADWRPALTNALRAARKLLYVVSWFGLGSQTFDPDLQVWNNYIPHAEFLAHCAHYGRCETVHLGDTATAVAVYKQAVA